MRLRILQGGQTGVDRGAWRGAVESGLLRGGWMPHDMRDEYGPIPDEVANDLKRHSAGLLARTRQNVRESDAVVIVITDAVAGIGSPGTQRTFVYAKVKGKPALVIDGSESQLARLEPWWRDMSRRGRYPGVPFDLMLAGPRASLWPDGEETARRVVHRIAEVCR